MKLKDKVFLFSKTPYSGVTHIPIIKTVYFQPDIDFSRYDYIIATSKEVFTALDKIGHWRELPVLAISASTAEFAKKNGAQILDIADGYGKDVLLLIKDKYKAMKALHPRAKEIAYEIKQPLLEANISIESFVVYETSCSSKPKVELPSDAICIFTSPSCVKCFEKYYKFLSTYKVICIGETTRMALPEGVNSFVSEKTSVQSTIEYAKVLLKSS